MILLAAVSQGIPAPASAVLAVGLMIEGRASLIEGARGESRLAWTVFGVIISLTAGLAIGDTLPSGSSDTVRAAAGLGGGIGSLIVAWNLARHHGDVLRRRSHLPPSEPESRDPAWPVLHVLLVPFLYLRSGLTLQQRRPQGSLLLMLRWLYLAFVGGLPLYWFVLSFWLRDTSPTSSSAALLFGSLAVALGLAALIVRHRIEQSVIGAAANTVAATYRANFFLSLGVAEVAPLLSFVGTFLTGAPWLYPLGMLAAAPAFVRLAPSAANLRRIDEQRRIRGGASLYAIVVQTWPGDQGGPALPPPPA